MLRVAFASTIPNKEYVTVAEVTGAGKAIRRAGNNIDSILSA